MTQHDAHDLRTPKDLAIEYAHYLAGDAEDALASLLNWQALKEAAEHADGDGPDASNRAAVDEATERLSESIQGLREGIHEFRKRAQRAAVANDAAASWQPMEAGGLAAVRAAEGDLWLTVRDRGGNVRVEKGRYGWRQGWAPDGFNIEGGGRVGVDAVVAFMPFITPAPASLVCESMACTAGEAAPARLPSRPHA